MIQKERIRHLNEKTGSRGAYVLYWMQASQRAQANHALEYSIREANATGKPVIVYFGVMESYPAANARHYRFMLEGISEVRESLRRRGIAMVIAREAPYEGAVRLSKDAALLVADRGYTLHQREWRAFVAERAHCRAVEVESDVVVPVETASIKEEYAAATIRPKIREKLPYFMVPLGEQEPRLPSLSMGFETADPMELEGQLPLDRSVEPVASMRGGASEAQKRLRHFIAHLLDGYDVKRNDPALEFQSQMSPYLHFGQIPPLLIALEVQRAGGPGAEAYLEELIVRRELSVNYLWYNPRYGSFEGLPPWAAGTLEKHGADRREVLYSLDELEAAKTHDPYWNAAQKEMVIRGKMHGYMRMYWGKKILEWSPSPREAFGRALYLNDKYELDGRDPNGYTGIAWCFGKHDRPWKERGIFGTVRYMNARGLERKFDARAYVAKVNSIERGARQ
ncbi:MAG: deoxyribodipyrimidine photo-lyase [Candidatus Eremiobacteraeota bacterium]|nr:deoxyribodipyrimidine photo-lyase [Candidatus Eremiobacteraeota bacterium]